MQSIIIVGEEKEDLSKKVEEIVSENKISKFDIDLIPSEKQIGIGEVRNIGKKIFLTPVKSAKKAVVVESFYGMTLEAQNSFLKILEEPPLSTIIIMLTNSLDFFLPTILSRCTVLNLEKINKLSEEEQNRYLEILKDIKKNRISASLYVAQENSKSKEEALSFLKDIMVTAHNQLGKGVFSDKEIAKMLKEFQKSYTIIKSTNVNVRFALEDLFLHI